MKIHQYRIPESQPETVQLWRGIVDCASFPYLKRIASPFEMCALFETGLQIHCAFFVGMECNIDQKGRLARLYTGIVAIAFGIVLALLTYLSVIPAALGWVTVGGIIFGGAFAIFEARKGWCIVRAVGIKTPL